MKSILNILNEINDYYIIHCDKNGKIINANNKSSEIISNYKDKNILDFIQPEYCHIIKKIIDDPINFISQPKTWVVGFNQLINCYINVNIVKNNDILFSFKNICDNRPCDSFWSNKLLTYKLKIQRAHKILLCVSSICKNVLYKTRSDIEDILLDLCNSLNLKKATICFKNGKYHIYHYGKENDDKYYIKKLDIDTLENCTIISDKNYLDVWDENTIKPKKYICDENCPCKIHNLCSGCSETVKVYQLSLQDKVIGYFEYVSSNNKELNSVELEALDSLSQVLAYIINNKEETRLTIDFIKSKFKELN